MQVVVRVEGRGLCNVTAAWVSGAAVDAATGKSTPISLDIISLPKAPLPQTVAAVKKQSSLPLSGLVSWVAAAVGWVAVLRQLQPAGRSDYLLARVKLPLAVVNEAQRAASDPLAVAVGEVPRLMCHLQSDFAVHTLPLTLLVDGQKQNSHHRFLSVGRLNSKNLILSEEERETVTHAVGSRL